jgi:carboxymethylenebutenolidase
VNVKHSASDDQRVGIGSVDSLYRDQKKETIMASWESPPLTPAQQTLSGLWDEHIRHEFSTKNTEHTLETMVEDATVNHVPVLTGGSGKNELREFYSQHFIPRMPPDFEIIPISRTVGGDRLVDEMVARFTHSVPMDWCLPGIAPTGKSVILPMLVVVQFRGDKLANERIYWDQASLLVQVGLLDSGRLPVVGAASANKVLNPALPSNELIERSKAMTESRP